MPFSVINKHVKQFLLPFRKCHAAKENVGYCHAYGYAQDDE